MGGTTYFYLGNAAADTVGTEEGTESVSNCRNSEKLFVNSAQLINELINIFCV